MSGLASWYPGHTVIGLCVIVATVVTFLSTTAWVASLFLERHASVRHSVLLSALVAALISPLFALAFVRSGTSFVVVPLLRTAEMSAASPEKYVARQSSEELPLAASPGSLATGGASQVNVKEVEPQAPAQTLDQAAGSRSASVVQLRAVAVAVLLVWAGGAVLAALGILRGVLLLGRLNRSLRPVSQAKVERLILDSAQMLGAQSIPTVMVSPLARTPLAAGFVRKLIVLPTDLIDAISDEQLRDVLMHEIAHIERRDNLIVLLQTIAKAAFWPIPFVHLLNGQLAQAREDICDNYVLACRDAVSYGETLLRMAQLACRAPIPLGTVGMLHWRGKLEHRIFGLIHRERNKMTRTPRPIEIGVLILFLSAGGFLSGSSIISAGTQPASNAAAEPAVAALQVADVIRLAANPEDEERRAAIAAIEALGGRMTLDERGNPTKLNMDGVAVTDAELLPLKGLTSLEALNLSRTRVTDAGLETLKGLNALSNLELYETTITDAGLEHLRGLPKLKFLMLKRTNVTDAGASRLQEVLPDCLISHSPLNPQSAQMSQLVGRWDVEFVNGVKQTCEIRENGTATVSEPGRNAAGKAGIQNRALVIEYEDDRVERWTFVGKRLVVEHWAVPGFKSDGAAPLRPLVTSAAVLGIAERLSAPDAR